MVPMHQISVIIPIFNVEKYIAECLVSVMEQSLEDIEILCVDDCGTDNSMAIVQELAAGDPRIRILRHERNRGQGPGRNTGIMAASGKYLYFLDSDDLFDNPHTLRDLMAQADATDCDICIGAGTTFADDPNDQALQRWCLVYRRYLRPMPVDSYRVTEYNFRESIHNFPGSVCGRLYRRDFLLRHDLTFIDANIVHQDEGFHRKTFSMLPSITMTDVLTFRYRQRPGSMIRNLHQRESHMDELFGKAILADVFQWLREHTPNAHFFISQLLADSSKPAMAELATSPAEQATYNSVADYAEAPNATALAALEKAVRAYPMADFAQQTAQGMAALLELAQHGGQKDLLPDTVAQCPADGQQRLRVSKTILLSRNREHLARAFYVAYPAYCQALKKLWRAVLDDAAQAPRVRFEHLPRNVETFCLAYLALCDQAR